MKVKLFKALASETRIKIVELLMNGELCCEDLSKCLNKDISTISRHIKILEDAGIVNVMRRDKYKCLSLRNKDKIKALLDLSEEIIKNV